MKRFFFALTLTLLTLSFVMPMPAPQADAQGFAREDTVVACGTFGQCYQNYCLSSTVMNCSGFTDCPC